MGNLDYNTFMIYDRFQEEAIEYINQGHSVIVSAPTGAGKTAIAEHIIDTCIQNKVGVIYTAPIKAISNQKFRDFTQQYGDHIGILTGDVSLNAQAPVLIMTTEIF
ncbi:MAG: DEAD/DEAH box helicase, partial [Candidatus Omnitrophica bacterium]|nr:DEAD/DEAH box helicase [Candidatus Omnitrophota bacterium]